MRLNYSFHAWCYNRGEMKLKAAYYEGLGGALAVLSIALQLLGWVSKATGSILLGIAVMMFVFLGAEIVRGRTRRKRAVMWGTVIIGALIGGGTAFLWSKMAAPAEHDETGKTAAAVEPSVNVDAYIQPGSANPYPTGTIIGGIPWNDRYSDVRLDFTVGSVAIRNLDFAVGLDTSIAGIGQLSEFAGVTMFPGGPPTPVVSLEGTDEKGNPITIPVVKRPNSNEVAPVYRVHCDALYANTVLRLVIASVALNQPDHGKLPKQLFAPRKPPRAIQLKGTFETSSGREFPVELRKVL